MFRDGGREKPIPNLSYDSAGRVVIGLPDKPVKRLNRLTWEQQTHNQDIARQLYRPSAKKKVEAPPTSCEDRYSVPNEARAKLAREYEENVKKNRPEAPFSGEVRRMKGQYYLSETGKRHELENEERDNRRLMERKLVREEYGQIVQREVEQQQQYQYQQPHKTPPRPTTTELQRELPARKKPSVTPIEWTPERRKTLVQEAQDYNKMVLDAKFQQQRRTGHH